MVRRERSSSQQQEQRWRSTWRMSLRRRDAQRQTRGRLRGGGAEGDDSVRVEAAVSALAAEASVSERTMQMHALPHCHVVATALPKRHLVRRGATEAVTSAARCCGRVYSAMFQRRGRLAYAVGQTVVRHAAACSRRQQHRVQLSVRAAIGWTAGGAGG